MTDTSTERRAYFASLATPDLIVCATIERGSFAPDDLAAIQDELLRRGIDPARLALPATADRSVPGPSPDYYSGPLPTAGRWWSEGWSLFTRHLAFLVPLSLVLFIPYFVLSSTLGGGESWILSIIMVASVLLYLAFDALVASAVLRGLCRRMTAGHCSLGRAASLGVQRWGWVLKNSLKALALSIGPGLALIALGATTDRDGAVAVGVILLIYPGIYFFLRYTWVQPLAALRTDIEDPLKTSRTLMEGRYGRLLAFMILAVVFGGMVALAGVISSAIMPGHFLDGFAWGFMSVLYAVCFKTAILVGFLHIGSSADLKDSGSSGDAATMPAPPSL